MAFAAGGFLGKLQREGLIQRGKERCCMTECYLTNKGGKALFLT